MTARRSSARRAHVTGSDGRLPAATIDDVSGWGRFCALTWREIATQHPLYARAVATNQISTHGRLAAEALAEALGVRG